MKKLAASALIALTLATSACTSPAPSLADLRPTSATPAASPSCEEDMPCWVCSPKDDSCGEDPDRDRAWATWEKSDGAHSLKLDPSRPYRVDWMAVTDDYPQNMDTYDLALVGTDGRWYVFRATYLDAPEETGNAADSADRT